MSAQREPINVLELAEWFEDIAERRSGPRVLTLPGISAIDRLDTVRAFYRTLAQHPKYSGTWPLALESGALTPAQNTHTLPAPLRFAWLGICGSVEPAMEPLQLALQLKAIGRLQGAPSWLHELSFGELEATFGPHIFESAGELADHAFAHLGPSAHDNGPTLTATLRFLDSAVATRPPLKDGGVLQLDAPGPEARALLAAGWIQRLGRDLPIVLAIDEAQKAGPFLASLVDLLVCADTPIMVVIAGEPFAQRSENDWRPRSQRRRGVQADEPEAEDDSRLAGAFRVFEGAQIAATSLPGGDHGVLTAFLAASAPGGLFSRRHVEILADTLDLGDASAMLAAIVEAGWLRAVAPDVFAFISDARYRLALRQAQSAYPADQLASIADAVASKVTDHLTAPTRELSYLVELGARAQLGDQRSRADYARLLAMYGDTGKALNISRALPAAAIEPARRVWAGTWTDEADAIPASDPLDQVEHLLVKAAVTGDLDATRARAFLARALQLLQAYPDHAVGREAKLRLACARIFLALGDLAGTERAMGPNIRELLSEQTLAQLGELNAWRNSLGIVAHTTEIMSNLILVRTLRWTMPGSVALATALIRRLELLEQVGMLEHSSEALPIAFEASDILQSVRERRPDITWRAALWLSWAQQRQGDTASALASLDALLIEQRKTLAPTSPLVLATIERRARCLFESEKFEEAHTDIDTVLHERLRNVEDDDADLIETHHWHAEIVAKLGDHAAAATELTDVVRRREQQLGPDDERLLSSRHRLGAALANTGRFDEAMRHLNEVVARRSGMAVPDSPRLLAARHSRGICLLLAGRHSEAIAELDQVLTHRVSAMPADAALLVDARADRATCYLVLGRFAEALADLDDVVVRREATLGGDHPKLVLSRQQRVICLLNTGREHEAAALIDRILTDTAATWPADNPMLLELRAVRAQLQPV